MIDCLGFNTQAAIFQLYSGDTVIMKEPIMTSHSSFKNKTVLILLHVHVYINHKYKSNSLSI